MHFDPPLGSHAVDWTSSPCSAYQSVVVIIFGLETELSQAGDETEDNHAEETDHREFLGPVDRDGGPVTDHHSWGGWEPHRWPELSKSNHVDPKRKRTV